MNDWPRLITISCLYAFQLAVLILVYFQSKREQKRREAIVLRRIDWRCCLGGKVDEP